MSQESRSAEQKPKRKGGKRETRDQEPPQEVQLHWGLPEAMALSFSRIILRGDAQKMLEEEEE